MNSDIANSSLEIDISSTELIELVVKQLTSESTKTNDYVKSYVFNAHQLTEKIFCTIKQLQELYIMNIKSKLITYTGVLLILVDLIIIQLTHSNELAVKQL